MLPVMISRAWSIQKEIKYLFSFMTNIVDVYCFGVWGYEKFLRIDKIQNRALRYFLWLHRFTHVLALHDEVGWLPSTQRCLLNMFRMWNKLIRREIIVWPKKHSTIIMIFGELGAHKLKVYVKISVSIMCFSTSYL